MSVLPDETFSYSRQKFQYILTRLEILVTEIQDSNTSRDTIKKIAESILASSNDYARFLRDIQRC